MTTMGAMKQPTSGSTWLERKISLHSYDSEREERANALTHGLGALLAPVGLLLLLLRDLGTVPIGVLLADLTFGLTMVLLYVSSTLYHLSRVPRRKRLLRVFDHMSIYLLIAGTYTPLMARISEPWARNTLILVWLLAVAGMGFKIIFWGRFRVLQVLFYLGMGWLAVIRWEELLRLLPAGLLWSILTGGVLYTLGTVVYGMKRLPYYHAIWHLFVLGGSLSFFIGIYLFF